MRVVVERLARRLGYDAVAANIPEEHRKLLTHIRKEKSRKLRDDKADKVQPAFFLPSLAPCCLSACTFSVHICSTMFLSTSCLDCTQVRVAIPLCMQVATNFVRRLCSFASLSFVCLTLPQHL